MAKYSRIEVAQTMKDNGMVPLFFHSDIEISKKVLKACYDGGSRLMEFTSRGDFAFEVFGALNKYALAELPGMILGVDPSGRRASRWPALGEEQANKEINNSVQKILMLLILKEIYRFFFLFFLFLKGFEFG